MKKEYYVAILQYEQVDLYLNRGGIWGEFSIGETILAPNPKALNYHYYKWNKCEIKDDYDVRVQKVCLDITFEETVAN